YSVYLLHPLVFDAYRKIPALHRPHTLPDQWLLYCALLAVIIALSGLTYYLVEKPMQRAGRRVAAWAGYGTGTGAGEPAATRDGTGAATAGSRSASSHTPGGGRARRPAVAERDHAPRGPAQPGGPHSRVAGGPQRQVGQQGDAEPGRHQRLRGDEVIGGEGDPGGEPGQRALLEQVLAAAVAAGDPALVGQ